jgi:hypothetical protein
VRLTTLSIILVILVAFFMLTNVAPEILLVALLLTGGLALPLLFLNTVLLYFAAAYPALALLGSRPRPWRLIALAACIIPAVAVIPPAFTQIASALKMRSYRSDDVMARLPETPKSIELSGASLYYGGPNDILKSAPCDELCQRLLLSRKVDVIRVTRTPESGLVKSQMDYVIEQRSSCPNAFGDGDPLLPVTKDAVASGTCFVPRPPDTASMAVRIDRRKTSMPDPGNLAEDIAAAAGVAREVQRIEIITRDATGGSPKLRQTQVRYTHWMMPWSLSFASCYGMCIGRPVFTRIERTLNPFDPDKVALEALGVGTTDPADRLSPAARVMVLLDGAGQMLTPNQMLLINDWARMLPCQANGCAPVAGDDERLAMRLAKDRRVTDFVFVGMVFQRNRRLVADNLDLFLDEMEARGANSHFSNIIGAIIPQLDNALVHTRRERILALMEANAWTWSWGIGIASGRLGIDTRALISERLGRKVSAQTAALAACTADEAIGRALVPNLLAYLRALPVSDQFADNADRDAVKALARWGHFEEAKEIYLSRFPKFGEHSLPRQSAEAVVNDVNACFRG